MAHRPNAGTALVVLFETVPHDHFYKIGKWNGESQEEIVWPNIYQVLPDKDRRRIAIAAADPLAILKAVLDEYIADEMRILYNALPRGRHHPDVMVGRYTVYGQLREAADKILGSYYNLLARDARHEFWIGDESGREIVLDLHNFVYVYGDMPLLEPWLEERGFLPGCTNLGPHCHNYHDEMDPAEATLLSWEAWSHSEPYDMDYQR
jgi:hypothetical protein